MMDMQSFKEQLLEFVEDREDPFDESFLVKTCNQPVSDMSVRDTLYELVEEGTLVIVDHKYLATRVLMKRWLKLVPKEPEGKLVDPDHILSPDLIYEIREMLQEKPELGYVDISEFVRDAVRNFLNKNRHKRK